MLAPSGGGFDPLPSLPSHEGYRNTIKLLKGNNVVPLQSDTIRIHLHMGESYYSFPCSVLSTGKDRKTPQRYPNVPTTSRRIFLRSMDSFQRLTLKRKMKGKTYNLLPRGLVYDAILKKKITRNEDIGGNFEIPCNIGGIADDVLVDVVGYVYPVDFMILDIKEDENMSFILGTPFLTKAKVVIKFDKGTITLRSGKSKISFHRIPESLDIKENEKSPFILGTSFLTTAKPVIKFDKGTITLRSGKSKISFHRIPGSFCKDEKGIKNDIEPIAPTMTVNRLVLEWEEKIKLHQEKKMEFGRWMNKNFKKERPAPVKIKDGMDDEG
nr:hypothetical protein [Tanacetum cinerariifolium]